ncbi:hypothetical protein ONZ45_g5129 [Pleurotus djamor]|nr:hypothetical protein ONZ45_g5129 [Pleurotus djamor]
MVKISTRRFLQFAPFVALLSLVALLPAARAAAKDVYLIRNAEEPSLGLEGLTPIGKQRAEQCLPELFSGAGYDIGLVIACTPETNTSDCHTAVATAQPIATALGLTLNTQCSTIEANISLPTCVPDLITNFHKTKPSKGVLVVWISLTNSTLRTMNLTTLPNGKPDIIYTLRNGYFIGQSSQECAGIDGSSDGAALARTAGATTSSFGSASRTAGEPLSDGEPADEPTVTDSEVPTSSSDVPEPVTTFALADLTATVTTGETTSTPVAEPEPTPTTTEGVVAKRDLKMMKKRHMKKRLAFTDEVNDVAM